MTQTNKELIRAAGGIVHSDGNIFFTNQAALDAYVAAIAQPVPPAEGSLAIGTGAIYDFAGFLTTRDKRVILSGYDEAGPAAEAIKEFLEKRGIFDDVTPAIKDWHEIKPPVQPDSKEQAPGTSEFIKRTNDEYSEWCKTYYQADALDDRGMASLHGLWAWQEQARRKTCVDIAQPVKKKDAA